MYDPSMRVLTVLELLQARERVTGGELARRLEVSLRTVQRYITRLQDLGIPVESTRGVGGAYRLKPGFRLPPLMFTEDEALALALGLHALNHVGLTALAPAVEGARAKLARTLPHALRERVQVLEEAVQLDAFPWTVQTDGQTLSTLLAAMHAGRVVAFSYLSHAGEQTRREVAVYGTVHLGGRWYAVGLCQTRGSLRTFRLDRISQPVVLDATFSRPDDFDARAYLHGTLPFLPSSYNVDVWLDLPPVACEARFPPARVALEPAEEGGTRLRCKCDDLDSFAAILLSLGCGLKVQGPPELREAFGTLAARAALTGHGRLPG